MKAAHLLSRGAEGEKVAHTQQQMLQRSEAPTDVVAVPWNPLRKSFFKTIWPTFSLEAIEIF